MNLATYVNFREIWKNEGRELGAKPAIHEELQVLESIWEDILNFNDDEGFPHDALRAELRQVNFGEKVFDCDWLIRNFEPRDLVYLQLAVCRQKWPGESWQEFERYDHLMITNNSRTLVCDLFLQNEVSASASLAIGGVQDAPVTEEAAKYLQERAAQEEAVLEKLKVMAEKHRVSKFL